jgi:hypothetical protein
MIYQPCENLVELHCIYCYAPLQTEETDMPKTATARDVLYNEKQIKVQCPKCGCKFYISTNLLVEWYGEEYECCRNCYEFIGQKPLTCAIGGCEKVERK